MILPLWNTPFLSTYVSVLFVGISFRKSISLYSILQLSVCLYYNRHITIFSSTCSHLSTKMSFCIFLCFVLVFSLLHFFHTVFASFWLYSAVTDSVWFVSTPSLVGRISAKLAAFTVNILYLSLCLFSLCFRLLLQPLSFAPPPLSGNVSFPLFGRRRHSHPPPSRAMSQQSSFYIDGPNWLTFRVQINFQSVCIPVSLQHYLASFFSTRFSFCIT